MTKTSPLCYIKWVDANYQEGEVNLENLEQRCELNTVGFLVKETDHAVTLSLEAPSNDSTRNPFSIPKTNILEMRIVQFNKAFPKPRKLKEKIQ